MHTRKIPASPTDEIFRSHTRNLIDSARKEILVITGEVGSFRFPDLRWAAERARRRGVRVKVYASKPSQSTVNGLLAREIEVYVGPAVREHYVVVDSNSYVHSRPHSAVLGKRTGEVILDQPVKANRIVGLFQELAGKAKRVERIDWKKDPLWRALQKPFDWRVRTHASQLDKEFA